jgi:hypothetical protein
MKCSYIKKDGSGCTAPVMHDSNYCVFHNPDISDEERFAIRSEATKSHSSLAFGEGGWEGEVPPMKIENFQDIVNVMADSINRVRLGRFSEKKGSTLAYMSFIMLMAMDKAKAEQKQEKIDKLKAEGKWRPEPRYAPKFYTYKDDFFLDKDGNHLIVENDGCNMYPSKTFKHEEVEDSMKESVNPKSRPGGMQPLKKHRKRKVKILKIPGMINHKSEKFTTDAEFNNVLPPDVKCFNMKITEEQNST